MRSSQYAMKYVGFGEYDYDEYEYQPHTCGEPCRVTGYVAFEVIDDCGRDNYHIIFRAENEVKAD